MLQITNYFFTFNQPNYARWLVQYHDNLLMLSETHKDVHDEFMKGCFGIKRIKKAFSKYFSRLPIDLTLEQTVNVNAVSKKTAIPYFTNSVSARQLWADSHFVRMKVLSEVLNKLDMTTDASQDVKPNQIMKNTRNIEKMLRSIQENMNPFSEEVNKETA